MVLHRTSPLSCGLVMKEDITQPASRLILQKPGCGLVMKEDITQHITLCPVYRGCCGLVMKEDITQLHPRHSVVQQVVVW